MQFVTIIIYLYLKGASILPIKTVAFELCSHFLTQKHVDTNYEKCTKLYLTSYSV
jgi:hypothetical protein